MKYKTIDSINEIDGFKVKIVRMDADKVIRNQSRGDRYTDIFFREIGFIATKNSVLVTINESSTGGNIIGNREGCETALNMLISTNPNKKIVVLKEKSHSSYVKMFLRIHDMKKSADGFKL